MSNPCIRCGKERKVVKTWKKKIGEAMTIFTQTSCPDKECQKIVDKENEAREAKRLFLLNKRMQPKKGVHQLVLGKASARV